MKKLIKLMSLILVLLAVVGCTNNNDDDNDPGDDAGHEETTVRRTEEIVVPEGAVPYLIVNRDELLDYHVVLTDLLTGNTLGGILLEEEDLSVFDVFNFGNGYYGALIGITNPFFMDDNMLFDFDEDFFDEDFDGEFFDEDFDDDDLFDDDGFFDEDFDEDIDDDFLDEDFDDDLFDDDFFDDDLFFDDELFIDDEDVEDHDENLRYIVFDGELNILHDILITDPYLLSFWDHFTTHVVIDNDELIVYYVPDLFHLTDDQHHSLRQYNAMTGESSEIAELEDADLLIDGLALVDQNTLVFSAQNVEEGGATLYYGTVNLAHGDVTLFTEADFTQYRLTAVGYNVLFNEGVPLMLDIDEDHTALRNIALLFNVEANESQEIELGEGESRWARLSLNANYIVTVTSDFSSFRKYDVGSGEMIAEIELELDDEAEAFEVDIYAITDSTYAVYFFSELSGRIVQLIELP